MKVNPGRARRYLLRTMTPPEESFTLSRKDLDDHAWVEWEDRVRKYAKAKGFHPVITVQENPENGTKTIRWRRERTP